jgi:hypothetical protein
MSHPSATPDDGPSRARQTSERRAWIRFRTRAPEVYWQLFGAKEMDFWPAQLLNVSTRGIGLILDRAVATGTVLTFKFSKTDLKTKGYLVRVKHVSPLDGGKFKVGATFVVPLSDDQLHALVE